MGVSEDDRLDQLIVACAAGMLHGTHKSGKLVLQQQYHQSNSDAINFGLS